MNTPLKSSIYVAYPSEFFNKDNLERLGDIVFLKSAPLQDYPMLSSHPNGVVFSFFEKIFISVGYCLPIIVYIGVVVWVLTHIWEGFLKIAIDYNSIPSLTLMFFMYLWSVFEVGTLLITNIFSNL